MIPHTVIITFFDAATLIMLLMIADGLRRIGGKIFRNLSSMLLIISVEIVFAAYAAYLEHGTTYIVIKCIGRAAEAFAVWRFYRMLTTLKPDL